MSNEFERLSKIAQDEFGVNSEKFNDKILSASYMFAYVSGEHGDSEKVNQDVADICKIFMSGASLVSTFRETKKLTYFDATNLRLPSSISSILLSCEDLQGSNILEILPGLSNYVGVFSGCKNLATVSLPGEFTGTNIDISFIFNGCSAFSSLEVLQKLFGSGSQVSKAKFAFCNTAYTEIPQLYVDSLMYADAMFSDCKELTTVPTKLFNTSSGETSKLLSARGLFSMCKKLSTFKNTNNNSTTNVVPVEFFEDVNTLKYIGSIPGYDLDVQTGQKSYFYQSVFGYTHVRFTAGAFANTGINGVQYSSTEHRTFLDELSQLVDASYAFFLGTYRCKYQGGVSTETPAFNGTSVTFMSDTSASNIRLPHSVKDCRFMFAGSKIKLDDLSDVIYHSSGVNTAIENCSGMFAQCSNIDNNNFTDNSKLPNISGCSNLQNASYLLYNCIIPETYIPNTYFNGCSNLKDISYMFYGTNITSIQSGIFDSLTSLERASYTFADCKKFGFYKEVNEANKVATVCSITLSSGSYTILINDTSLTSGIEPKSLFVRCKKLKDVSYLFAGCTNMQFIPENLFYECATNIQKDGTVYSATFNYYGDTNLQVDLTNVSGLLYCCSKITQIPQGYMFSSCKNITNISKMCMGASYNPNNTDLWKGVNTQYYKIDDKFLSGCAQISNASQLFAYCSLLYGDIPSNFLLSSIQQKSLKNLKEMFICTDIGLTVENESGTAVYKNVNDFSWKPTSIGITSTQRVNLQDIFSIPGSQASFGYTTPAVSTGWRNVSPIFLQTLSDSYIMEVFDAQDIGLNGNSFAVCRNSNYTSASRFHTSVQNILVLSPSVWIQV